MANICIMFPNNSTSVILGHFLVSDLNNVSFFIPETGPHEMASFSCIDEVRIAAAGLDSTVDKISDYSKLDKFDYVIFPLLDLDPRRPRNFYATMLKNLFK